MPPHSPPVVLAHETRGFRASSAHANARAGLAGADAHASRAEARIGHHGNAAAVGIADVSRAASLAGPPHATLVPELPPAPPPVPPFPMLVSAASHSARGGRAGVQTTDIAATTSAWIRLLTAASDEPQGLRMPASARFRRCTSWH